MTMIGAFFLGCLIGCVSTLVAIAVLYGTGE